MEEPARFGENDDEAGSGEQQQRQDCATKVITRSRSRASPMGVSGPFAGDGDEGGAVEALSRFVENEDEAVPVNQQQQHWVRPVVTGSRSRVSPMGVSGAFAMRVVEADIAKAIAEGDSGYHGEELPMDAYATRLRGPVYVQ